MAANLEDLATLDDPAQSPAQDQPVFESHPSRQLPPEPVQDQPGFESHPSRQLPAEPYVPSRADRPYQHWTKPDFALQGAFNYPGIAPGPLMPQLRDLAGLIHGAVIGLGRFGSHYTGMPAIAMGTYANAYWTAYQKGMKERAAQSYQQYRMARQMTIDRGKEEMEEYAQIYGAYYKDGKITDPNAFYNEIYAAAQKYQNHRILAAIEGGHFEQIEGILGATDSHIMNLIKATHQEERQRQLDAEREEERKQLEAERAIRMKIMQKQLEGGEIPEEWKDIPSTPPSRSFTEPDTTDTAPADDADTKPADDTDANTKPIDDTAEPQPGDPAAGQTRGPTTTGAGTASPVPPTTPSKGLTLNPLVKENADEMVRTGKMPIEVPQNKAVQERVKTEAARQKAALGDLMDKGIITGDNENGDLAAIRKINPRVADDIEQMGHYRRPVPSGGENLFANMENLVHKVYPHYNAAIYDYVKDFRKGPESKIYESIGTLKNAAEGVLRELQNHDEKDSPPKNWIDKETGIVRSAASAKWGALANALFQYVEESITIQNGGRRPLASQTAREILAFPITRGAKTIRALLTTSAMADVGRIDAANHTWYSNTHLNEPPPGYDEHSAAWARALADIDYNTGYPRNPNTPVPDDMKPYLGPAGSNLHKPPPQTLPPGAPAGSRIMYKGSQPWLVYPDNSVHPMQQ